MGADCDGDEMSVVAVLDEHARQEAEGLFLHRLLTYDADEGAIPELSKDFLLGFDKAVSDEAGRAALGSDLKEAGVKKKPPRMPRGKRDRLGEFVGDYLKELRDRETNAAVLAAVGAVMDTALRGLDRVVNHSCFGPDPGAMKAFYRDMLDCRAARDRFATAEGDERDEGLMRGLLTRERLHETAERRIRLLIQGKTDISSFGGWSRRVFFQFSEHEGVGAAFEGETLKALRSLHAISEKATQSALSSKTDAPLSYGEFEKDVEALLTADEGSDKFEDALSNLSGRLDLEQEALRGHASNLRAARSAEDSGPSLLELLQNPCRTLCGLAPGEERSSPVSDPRVALFVS